jgi:hypothetical protein
LAETEIEIREMKDVDLKGGIVFDSFPSSGLARKIEHMKDLSARVSDNGDVSHILPWQTGHPARRRLGTTQGHPKGVFSFRAPVAGSHPQHCQGVEAILQRRHMVSVEVDRAVQGNRIG